MSLYLARAGRMVIGADLTRASLMLAAAAARRFQLDRVQFIETDLHRPGQREGSFDVVYVSGVLHHTPDPRGAFARISGLARPGGMIVLGLYNSFARIPLRLRRFVARFSRYHSFLSIRFCATETLSLRDPKHGSGTNIGIPRSTATRLPKFRAGLRRIASIMSGLIPAPCSVRNRGSCSQTLPITGVWKVGLRNWVGLERWDRKEDCSSQSVGEFDYDDCESLPEKTPVLICPPQSSCPRPRGAVGQNIHLGIRAQRTVSLVHAGEECEQAQIWPTKIERVSRFLSLVEGGRSGRVSLKKAGESVLKRG